MIETEALVARSGAATRRVGSLELLHRLELESVQVGEPGPGEVLVEVMAAGLCHSDVSVLTGDRPRELPMVLGHEAAGVVRELGAGVRRVRADDRVVMTFVPSCGRCERCRSGRPALCSVGNDANKAGVLVTGRRPFADRDGRPLNQHLGVSAFSRWTVVAEESLVPVEASFDFPELAVLGCAVLTGVGAVFNTAEVHEGDSVAVFGCGGVGLAAIMGARVAGAGAIIAVDVVPTRLERALDAGADTALLSHPRVADEIVELTHGGVSCAIEAAGLASAIEDAYDSTAVGGQVVTVGLAHPQAEIRLRPADLVATGRRVVGSYMGSAVPQRDVPRLVALFERSRMPLHALVGQRHPLIDFERALAALGDDGPGRQVLLT